MEQSKRKQKEKILVLATAQKSSLRLIEYGAALAAECDSELHILHVQQGDNVFQGNESLQLLENLAEFGYRQGGILHLACEQDVAAYIGQFAAQEKITQVILGRPRTQGAGKKKRINQFERILGALPEGIEVRLYPSLGEAEEENRKIG